MNIGIGVCSYKRPEMATDTCKSILGTIDSSVHNITTVCSLDSSNKEGYDWVAQNFNLIYGANTGISYNKNRLIKYLAGNDFIFLVEDDILLKAGWLEIYLKAYERTGFNHFNYIVSHYREFIKKTISYGDITIGDSGSYVNGVFMMISKKCVDLVGGFDIRYKRYGYEHADYTNRCKKAGLCPDFNFHVMEASPYIDWLPSSSCISEEEKKESIKYNAKIFHAPIRSVYDGSYKEVSYINA